MPDDYDDRLRQHSAMLHDVPRMLAIQHALERIDRALDDIRRTIAQVEMMQAHMGALVARFVHTSIVRAPARPRR